MNNIRKLTLLVQALALVSIFPRSAWAIQPHGPPEGFYLHQIGHLVFTAALIFFLYKLWQEIQDNRSFRLLAWACALFVLWNLDTFTAHFCALSVSPQDFLGQTGELTQRLTMSNTAHWIYYFASFDSLLLVPACYLFYRGLKALAQGPVTGKP